LLLLHCLSVLIVPRHQRYSAVVERPFVVNTFMQCWRWAWKRVDIDVIDVKRVYQLADRVLALQQLVRPVGCWRTHPSACAILQHSRGSGGVGTLIARHRVLSPDVRRRRSLLLHASWPRLNDALVRRQVLNVVACERGRGRLVPGVCLPGAHCIVLRQRILLARRPALATDLDVLGAPASVPHRQRHHRIARSDNDATDSCEALGQRGRTARVCRGCWQHRQRTAVHRKEHIAAGERRRARSGPACGQVLHDDLSVPVDAEDHTDADDVACASGRRGRARLELGHGRMCRRGRRRLLRRGGRGGRRRGRWRRRTTVLPRLRRRRRHGRRARGVLVRVRRCWAPRLSQRPARRRVEAHERLHAPKAGTKTRF